jgi:hypothetical protein
LILASPARRVSKELICGVKPPFSFGSVSTFHSGGGVDGIDDKGRVMMLVVGFYVIIGGSGARIVW